MMPSLPVVSTDSSGLSAGKPYHLVPGREPGILPVYSMWEYDHTVETVL